MSNEVEHGRQQRVPGHERGLWSLQQASEVSGPVGLHNDHEHSTDHFALIYESREGQFAAAIPFIRQGLDRGERCLYVADENSRDDILTAMETQGIDVESAIDSGALSILTPADTYRRTGEFDRD